MRPQDRTRAIMRSGLDHESKAVAVAIADYMGDKDLAWPSVPTLAADASLGERTVQRRIAEGVRAGWLVASASPGRATAYTIVWSALPGRAAVEREHDPRRPTPVRETPPSGGHPRQTDTGVPETPHPRQADTPPPSGRHPTPVRLTGEGTKEAIREQTKEQTTHEHGPVAAAGADGRARVGCGVPLAELDRLWSRVVAFTTKPGAWKLTDARRKHLRARIADHGVEAVEHVADWVRSAPHDRAAFLRQRGDPDTLLRPEKFSTYLGMCQQPEAAQPASAAGGGRRRRAPTIAEILADEDPPDPAPRPRTVDATWSPA